MTEEHEMKRGKRRSFHILAQLVATAVFGLGASPARAQYGMGMGVGFFGGFGQVPSPSQFINDHALVRAGAGRREPARNVYSNNSNSYLNRIRDNGLSSHSSARSHRSPGYDVDRRPTRSLSQASNNTPQPVPEAAPRPVHPSAAFSTPPASSSGRARPRRPKSSSPNEISRIRPAWLYTNWSRSTSRRQSRRLRMPARNCWTTVSRPCESLAVSRLRQLPSLFTCFCCRFTTRWRRRPIPWRLADFLCRSTGSESIEAVIRLNG